MLTRRVGPSGAALMELSGHAHAVWRARCNPFYDQLLLSCSSDATVGLWYTPSVAAAAAGGRPGAGAGPASPVPSGKPPGDGRVKSFADHEESVYGALQSCLGSSFRTCSTVFQEKDGVYVASLCKLDALQHRGGFGNTLTNVARPVNLLHIRRCGVELGGAVGVCLCVLRWQGGGEPCSFSDQIQDTDLTCGQAKAVATSML